MEELFDYPENDFRLYHHGILGQKWGRKNGPPYPLDESVSTGSRLKTAAASAANKVKETAGKIKEHRAQQAEIRSAKKQEKAEAKAAKKQADEEAKAAKQAEEKEKAIESAIKSGNASEISKYSTDMSVQQFNEAVQRAELNKRLANTQTSSFDKAVKIAQNVANLTNSASNIYNNISSISKKMDEADEARAKKAEEARAKKIQDREQVWIRKTSPEAFLKNESKLSTAALKERKEREDYKKAIEGRVEKPKPEEPPKPANNHKDSGYQRNNNNAFWSGSYRKVKKEETQTYAQIVNDIMKSDEYKRLSARLP